MPGPAVCAANEELVTRPAGGRFVGVFAAKYYNPIVWLGRSMKAGDGHAGQQCSSHPVFVSLGCPGVTDFSSKFAVRHNSAAFVLICPGTFPSPKPLMSTDHHNTSDFT